MMSLQNDTTKSQLHNKMYFLRDHIQCSLLYSLFATVVALIITAVILAYSGWPDSYQLYFGFEERSIEDSVGPVPDVVAEILIAFGRIISAAQSVFNSTKGGNVAGIARLATLIAVVLGVTLSYRKKLALYYQLNGQDAQLADFNQLVNEQKSLYRITRFLYIVASGFGAYVVISSFWLAADPIFLDLYLDTTFATVIIIVFTFLATFGAVYWAMTVSTRRVLLLSGLTFVAGLLTSFSMISGVEFNGLYWYQTALSTAGANMPSAPFFTAALLSTICALFVLIIDIDSIIDKRLQAVEFTRWKRLALYGSFFFLIVAIFSVSTIRVVESNILTINQIFHTAIGGCGSIAALLIFSWLILDISQKTILTQLYTFIICGCVAITAIVALFMIGVLFNWRIAETVASETPRELSTLTAIELVVFSLAGVVLFCTIETFLLQGNAIFRSQANPMEALEQGRTGLKA